MNNDALFNQVENNINKLVKDNVSWSVPVTHEEIEKIKEGIFNISISENKFIPRDWFPQSLKGIKYYVLLELVGSKHLCAQLQERT